MDIAIPEDQLAKVRPIVEQAIRDLRALSAKLPDDADSALIYSPSESPE